MQIGLNLIRVRYAEAYHYDSISRGDEDTPEKQERFKGEVTRFQMIWRKELEKGEPYYNSNLTLDREDFGLRYVKILNDLKQSNEFKNIFIYLVKYFYVGGIFLD